MHHFVPSPRLLHALTLAALSVVGCGEHKITSHNSAPVASITDPTADDNLVENIPYLAMGQVSDEDESAERLVTHWRIGTRDACTDVIPSADGSTQCELTMLAEDLDDGTVKISLTVVDSRDGNATTHVVAGGLPNRAPEVSILEPADGGDSPNRFYVDEPIDLVGQVGDTEDALDELTVSWESNLDGPLPLDIDIEADGTLRNSTFLSQGNQMLTLRVTDLGGLTTADQVLIAVVGPNEPPLCNITIPSEGAVFNEDDSVSFAGTASDPNEDDLSNLSATWESTRDGVISTDPPDSSGLMAFDVTDLTPGDHVIQLVVRDDGELSCADTLTLSVRANPYFLAIGPTDGTIITEGDSVELTARVADVETTSSALVVGWESSLDGPLGDTTADTLGYAALIVDAPSAGTHTITATVTDTDGMSASDTFTLVTNQRPTMPDVSLSPTPPSTSDDLLATINVESIDPEGEPVSYSFEWQVDGALSLVSTTDILPSSATRKGQEWTILVTPSDGDAVGPSGVASLTIQNSAPSAGTVTISPSEPLSTDELSCMVTGASDVDGDEVGLAYSWTVDDTPISATGETLDAADHTAGSFVSCTVTPSDEETSGTPESAAPVRINVPPVVHAVLVTPTEPTVEDTLSCDVGLVTDSDGDPVSHSIQWIIDDIDVGATGASLDSSWFGRDDEVSCRVTPSDGREDGTPVEADAITIQNALPEIDSLAVSPGSATTNTVLVANATGSDPDLDLLTFEYQWKVNGTPLPGVGDTLDGTLHFDKGDEIMLSVVVSDGIDTSAPAWADSILVENSPPTAPTVAITPSEPAAGVDSLVCAIDTPSTDDDLDDLTYEISWTRDGEAFGASTDTHIEGDTIPGHITWADEVWICTIIPNDGTEIGPPGATSVTPEWRFSGWGDEPFAVVDGDAHLLGTTSQAQAGLALAVAGDVDGDGMLDILVGAPQDDSGDSNAGRAYLALSSHFIGSDTALLSESHRIIEGTSETDRVGSSVAGGIALGGSSSPDILVGAYGADIMEPDDGAIGLFWDAGAASPSPLTLDHADVLLHGATDRELAGSSIVVIDDMNDDGLSELLVGAPHNDMGGTRSGTAYLVLGSAMTTEGIIDLGDHPKFFGESGIDLAGTAVHSAGDVDADGIPDLMVAAPYNETSGTRAGRVYIIHGVDALAYTLLTLGDADIRIHGDAPYDQAGLGLSGGHDIDGDGSPEILIGAPYHDDPAEDAGRAYMFWGSGLGSAETFGVTDADVIFTGTEAGGELGDALSSASDVDGDALHDVAIGVPVGTGDTAGAGVTLLFMGEFLSAGGVFSPSDASYSFIGTGGNDHAGRVLLGTGDLNGDGFGDLAISEPNDTTTFGLKSGSVHLLFAP